MVERLDLKETKRKVQSCLDAGLGTGQIKDCKNAKQTVDWSGVEGGRRGGERASALVSPKLSKVTAAFSLTISLFRCKIFWQMSAHILCHPVL